MKRAPRLSASDSAEVRPPKAPGLAESAAYPNVASWIGPPDEDRALVRDGLERNGAFDLAEILGLRTPQEAA